MRKLPPLNALKAFEACARLCSFSQAANELLVTQSAISRQVKHLEDHLGIQLFYRHPRRLELTEQGTALLPVLTDMFDRLALVTMAVQERAHELRLKLPPTFSVRWLIPRLSGFQRNRPEIQVQLSPAWQPVNFAKENFDAGIVCSTRLDAYDETVHTDLIVSEALTPICSPQLLKDSPPLGRPEDLLNLTLLHWRMDCDFWGLWFRELDIEPGFNGSVHHQYHELMDSAIHAAIRGIGVTLANPEFVRDEILIGRLVMPFEDHALNISGYHFVCPKALFDQPRVAHFRNWLLGVLGDGE